MLDRRAYYAEVKELENDFDSYIRALDGIVFNNSAQVFFEVVFIKYLGDNNTKNECSGMEQRKKFAKF